MKKKKVGSVKESPPVWDKFQTFVKEFFVCDPSEYVAQFPFLRKGKLQESGKYSNHQTLFRSEYGTDYDVNF